jgi:hypothetical protein
MIFEHKDGEIKSRHFKIVESEFKRTWLFNLPLTLTQGLFAAILSYLMQETLDRNDERTIISRSDISRCREYVWFPGLLGRQIDSLYWVSEGRVLHRGWGGVECAVAWITEPDRLLLVCQRFSNCGARPRTGGTSCMRDIFWTGYGRNIKHVFF